MSDVKYCKDCKNINCPEGRVNCKYPDAIACDLYCATPHTVFETITTSQEVLAEKLVYRKYYILRDETWTSNVLTSEFETEAEAIAATVAKLKEVCNE